MIKGQIHLHLIKWNYQDAKGGWWAEERNDFTSKEEVIEFIGKLIEFKYEFSYRVIKDNIPF